MCVHVHVADILGCVEALANCDPRDLRLLPPRTELTFVVWHFPPVIFDQDAPNMFDRAAAARPVLPHLGRLLHPHREGVAQLRAQGEACTCMVSRWDRLEVKNLVIYTTIDLETVFPAAVAAHSCHVTPNTRLDRQLPPLRSLIPPTL